jgi:hypothetical protein
MNELLDLVLHAHGGLDRWRKFNKVSAMIVAGGGLLPMKGLDVDPEPLEGTVSIHQEKLFYSGKNLKKNINLITRALERGR